MAYDGPSRPEGAGRRKRAERPFSFETRIRLCCLVFAAPTVVFCVVLLWQSSLPVRLAVVGIVVLALLLLSSMLLEEVVRPMQTLANVVAALREQDYSFRARGANRSDALGELSTEINALADMLQSQRVGELEATALLRRVIDSMDAPVLAFDTHRRLRLLNPAAERVLLLDAARDSGRPAGQLDVDHLLDAPDEGVIALNPRAEPSEPSARKPGRWMVRRSAFRQGGIPHVLLLLSDVSSALREEERTAWQRLIRVLGHEINNSLAPIKSIAGSLLARLPAEGAAGDGSGDGFGRGAGSASSNAAGSDFARGLAIIEGRAESLNRFVQAYRRLAQLPPPAVRPVALRPLLERVVAVETRMAVALGAVPAIEIDADPDQFEQLLINLVKNAVEAVIAAREEAPEHSAARGDGAVTLSASELRGSVVISVEDTGLGLSNTENLFVPFYTTKKDGSGVGLALVRQIAEAHGGTVSLRNREGASGCVAEVLLPLARGAAPEAQLR